MNEVNNNLEEIIEKCIESIYSEVGIIHFIHDYMDMLPEVENFITIVKLMEEVEKGLF